MKTNKKIASMLLILFGSYASVPALSFRRRRPNASEGAAIAEPKTLLDVVELGNEQKVLEFLAKNQDVAQDVDKPKNHMGQTALMIAAKNGDTKNLKILLTHGANMSLRDNNSQTASDLSKDLKTAMFLMNEAAESTKNFIREKEQEEEKKRKEAQRAEMKKWQEEDGIPLPF